MKSWSFIYTHCFIEFRNGARVVFILLYMINFPIECLAILSIIPNGYVIAGSSLLLG